MLSFSEELPYRKSVHGKARLTTVAVVKWEAVTITNFIFSTQWIFVAILHQIWYLDYALAVFQTVLGVVVAACAYADETSLKFPTSI